MNNCPTQREESHLLPLQFKRIISPQSSALFILEPRIDDLGLELDQLIVARVGNAEFEGRNVMVRSNDRQFAVQNICGRPREPRKNHSSRQGKSQQSSE